MSRELISTRCSHRTALAGSTGRVEWAQGVAPAVGARGGRAPLCNVVTVSRRTGTTRTTGPPRCPLGVAQRSGSTMPACPPTSPCCGGSTSARTSAWRCRRCARSSSRWPHRRRDLHRQRERGVHRGHGRIGPSPATWRRRSRTSWASPAASSSLTSAELARAVADNPYPDEPDPKRVHAIFLTGERLPRRAARRARRRNAPPRRGRRDEAAILGRTLYLHTPDGFGRSELAAELSRARRPGGGHGPQLGDGDQAARDVRGLTGPLRGPSHSKCSWHTPLGSCDGTTRCVTAQPRCATAFRRRPQPDG